MLRRRFDHEMMDDFSIQDERVDRALEELKQINRYLGGRTTTRKALQVLQQSSTSRQPLSVLDVGAGGADVFEGLNGAVKVTALDRNPRVCRYLKDHGCSEVICANVLQAPLGEKTFDVVHASLFLHHFRGEELRKILSSCLSISRYAVIINDLRRSVLAWLGIKILTAIFSRSPMVKHDGPVSVLRGFTKSELKDLLASCGVTKYILRRRWAFRWMVVVLKSSIENRQFPISME